MKEIPCVDVQIGTKFQLPEPDGLFAAVSYSAVIHAGSQRGFKRFGATENPHPWRVTIYKAKGGMLTEHERGSNPEDLLSQTNVAKVYLLGLDDMKRTELENLLSQRNVKLVDSVPSPVSHS